MIKMISQLKDFDSTTQIQSGNDTTIAYSSPVEFDYLSNSYSFDILEDEYFDSIYISDGANYTLNPILINGTYNMEIFFDPSGLSQAVIQFELDRGMIQDTITLWSL